VILLAKLRLFLLFGPLSSVPIAGNTLRRSDYGLMNVQMCRCNGRRWARHDGRMSGCLDMIVADVMLDHPSWLVNDDGVAYRAVRCGSSIWSVTGTPVTGGWHVQIGQVSGPGDGPVLDVLDPSGLTGTDAVVGPLREAGPVGRLRNPAVWDALATSIVRQVIRADQALSCVLLCPWGASDHAGW
jgi:hypothetical protein